MELPTSNLPRSTFKGVCFGNVESWTLNVEPNAALFSAAMPAPSVRHPHVQLAISIALSTAAQVWLKLGAEHGENAGLFSGLHSPWVWLGIFAMIGSLLTWLNALRAVPLSLAFALAGVIHALVPLACWVWLGEAISGKRWMGIALVIAGVVVSARPAMLVEEKL